MGLCETKGSRETSIVLRVLKAAKGPITLDKNEVIHVGGQCLSAKSNLSLNSSELLRELGLHSGPRVM